jgi:hypothetical protein
VVLAPTSRNPSRTSSLLLLEVDPLCIQQNDLDEMSRQVGIMRDIYSMASRCCGVSGDADDSGIDISVLDGLPVFRQQEYNLLRVLK